VRRDGRWRRVALSSQRAFVVAVRGVVGPRELPVLVTYRGRSSRTFS
jgi:hypothetical protein